MPTLPAIAEWHERLLLAALERRRSDPDFRFNLRTSNGNGRLAAGYWFTGSEHYLFFAPFRPHDQNNKTRTIGFAIRFGAGGKATQSYLAIVFGSTADPRLRAFYEKLVRELGPFREVKESKFHRLYDGADPVAAFQEFLERDYPRLLAAIRKEHLEEEFLVGEDAFAEMFSQVERVRAGGIPPNGAAATSDQLELVVLGTWRGVGSTQAAHVRERIASVGGWASWWSFPINDAFRAELESRPFYVYLNSGGARFPYRMRATSLQSVRGNEGIPSPWPELTDEHLLGRTNDGASTSEVFKTWFRVDAFEDLQPPLTLDDFTEAPGIRRSALLNQASFGYAYPNDDGAEVDPITIPAKGQAAVNRIFYGPPGTGKTYRIQQLMREYTDTPAEADRATWLHQLAGANGWRAVIVVALADLGKARVPELRKHELVAAKIRERDREGGNVLPTLWNYLQHHTPESDPNVKLVKRLAPFVFTKDDEGAWSLVPDWQQLDEDAAGLHGAWKAGQKGALAPIARFRTITFHPSFSYEDFIRGIRPVTGEANEVAFRIVDGVFKQICDEAKANQGKRYALFIDEINRGNIAKVFGELITLIEVDKRLTFDAAGRVASGLTVQLPGSSGDEATEAPFGVPANLDIYGTMNTADRSIALLDIALRRRFEFVAIEPDYDLLNRPVDGVNLGRLLRRINDRLEYLLDADHRIGHAYLHRVNDLDDLRLAFEHQVVPLVKEYFFDDLSRVALVFGTTGSPAIVDKGELKHSVLFARSTDSGRAENRVRYEMSPSALWTADTFRGLYADAITETPPTTADALV